MWRRFPLLTPDSCPLTPRFGATAQKARVGLFLNDDGFLGRVLPMGTTDNFCVVIPAFREAERIASVIKRARGHCAHVVVVDDGSPDQTAEVAEAAGATVLRHADNKGKGAALETGFVHAVKSRFDFVITMDADGQHAVADIPAFLAAYREQNVPVIIGNRMAHPRSMPLIRKLTNRFMSWLLSREMGQRVPDTQNGYRLYRCDVLDAVQVSSARFAAESEILLSRVADHQLDAVGELADDMEFRGRVVLAVVGGVTVLIGNGMRRFAFDGNRPGVIHPDRELGEEVGGLARGFLRKSLRISASIFPSIICLGNNRELRDR